MKKNQRKPSAHPRLQLHLNLHAGGELEAHEGVDGLRGGLVHVDEPVVGAGLEVLAGVLVDVGGAEDAVDAALGGEGHRAGDGSLRRGGRLDDLVARSLHVVNLEGLEPDADLRRSHGSLEREEGGGWNVRICTAATRFSVEPTRCRPDAAGPTPRRRRRDAFPSHATMPTS